MSDLKEGVLEKVQGQLAALFLIFLTLGSIKQSNTPQRRYKSKISPRGVPMLVWACILSAAFLIFQDGRVIFNTYLLITLFKQSCEGTLDSQVPSSLC